MQAKRRPVHGILLLDKPAGISSNKALQIVKRLFNAAKAGHTGSLDPFATGLLPICFGEATKISAFLLNSDKRYQAEARLGEKTNTGDLDGDIISTMDVPQLTVSSIQSVMQEMCGEGEQIPPMFSAIKQDGKRLYELAREGKEVERPPRSITIFELECLDWQTPTLGFEVHCSKGTYVRTLAEDIAQKLGSTAHLRALRRTRVGLFSGEDMISLHDLEAMAGDHIALDKKLLPLDAGLKHLDAVNLDDNQTRALCFGQVVSITSEASCGLVRIYDSDDRIIGIGELRDSGELVSKRLFLGLVPEKQAG